MSPIPKKLRDDSNAAFDAMKAGAIALSALRQIQQMDDLYKRNKSVVKIANALQKGIAVLIKKHGDFFERVYSIEKTLAQKAHDRIEYSHGHNVMIEPISYIMYILYDREYELSRYFKINYNHVEKLENLTLYDKSVGVKYSRNADIFLHEYLELLDKQIKEFKNSLSKEIYKMEKGIAA